MDNRGHYQDRQQLFGPPAYLSQPQGFDAYGRPVDGMSTGEVVQQAVRTHQATTDSLDRSIAILQQTREMGTNINATLAHDEERLRGVDQKFVEMDDNLNKGIAHLKNLKRNILMPQARPASSAPTTPWGEPADPTPSYHPPPQQHLPHRAPQYTGVDTSALAQIGYANEAAEMQRHNERQAQQYSIIDSGLDDLLQQSKDMCGTLQRQNEQLSRMAGAADKLNDKVDGVNSKAQGFLGRRR